MVVNFYGDSNSNLRSAYFVKTEIFLLKVL